MLFGDKLMLSVCLISKEGRKTLGSSSYATTDHAVKHLSLHPGVCYNKVLLKLAESVTHTCLLAGF